jgi:NADH-quinone oxidoreductase subunit A
MRGIGAATPLLSSRQVAFELRSETPAASRGNRSKGVTACSPPACLALCTALSLLAPVIGTNPICDEGDFASAHRTLAGGRAFPYGAATSEVSSPMNELFLDYLPLVIFIAVALVIGLALLVVPFLIAYQAPDPETLSAYECGFNAFDDARMKFDVRFYLVAILFIIFDLEMSFLFPWAITLGELGL